MQPSPKVKIRYYLLPFSWIYALVIYIRHKLFDWNILKQKEYDIPIICVGNLTAGGTGKTPHTEYLVRLLQTKYRVGVLSRGYMRKSKGFVLAQADSTSRDLGDEPYQIYTKYPSTILAVDSDRRRGIQNMMNLETPPEVIILDDGFQHRYVKPTYSIILSNYNRPFYKDKLMPAGLLRDFKNKVDSANTIIITKCPNNLKPLSYRILTHEIDAFPYQNLYFTSFKYLDLNPVFKGFGEAKKLNYLRDKTILLVTGIASPISILKNLGKYSTNVETMIYKDHHNFTNKDLKKIMTRFSAIDTDNKILLVTEKDAARLSLFTEIENDFKAKIYTLPIEVDFSNENEEYDFNKKIIKHVEEYRRNSKFYKN